MVLRLFTMQEKIAALYVEVEEARKGERRAGSPAQRHYEVLKAIGADLRGREAIEDGAALADLDEALQQAFRSKELGRPGGYDANQLVQLANVLIKRWPAVRQALERFNGDIS